MSPFKLAKPHEIPGLTVFVVVHVVLWTLIPLLIRGASHFDSTEALSWGLTWEWGSNKHPPLSGWLAECMNRLTGNPDLAVYLLGQICVAAAFVYIYRLALDFLESETALLAAVFLEGIIYFNFSAVHFNVNVLSLALVPALMFYFWRAAQSGCYIYWLAAGILGGLLLLTKYTNLFFCLSLLCWLVFTPQGRDQLRSGGPWLCVLATALVFLPHMAWLARYNFEPLRYSQAKSFNGAPFSLNGIVIWPLRLFFAQGGNAAASLGLWALYYFRTPVAGRGSRRLPDAFLFCAGVLPLLLFLSATSLLGIRSDTKWLYAFISFVPLLLLYCLPARNSAALTRRMLVLTYLTMAAFGLGVTIKYLCVTSLTVSIDGRRFANEMKAIWIESSDQPLRYVGGESRCVSYVSTYLPERPRPVWAMDTRHTVWEEESIIRDAGVLVMARTEDEYREFREQWPRLPLPRRLDFPFNAPLSGKVGFLTVYYGVLPPESVISLDISPG